MLEQGFKEALFKDAPLTYMEMIDLVKFFKDKGHLNKAITIYKQEGFVSLMDYRGHLMNNEPIHFCIKYGVIVECDKCTHLRIEN